jgi:hypothetical protein
MAVMMRYGSHGTHMHDTLISGDAPHAAEYVSEDGFERVYQGSSLLLSWPLQLEPGAEVTVVVEQRVSVTRDRAET